MVLWIAAQMTCGSGSGTWTSRRIAEDRDGAPEGVRTAPEWLERAVEKSGAAAWKCAEIQSSCFAADLPDGSGKSPPWRSRQAIDPPVVVGGREPPLRRSALSGGTGPLWSRMRAALGSRVTGSQEPALRRAQQQAAANPGRGRLRAGFGKRQPKGPRRATTRSVRCRDHAAARGVAARSIWSAARVALDRAAAATAASSTGDTLLRSFDALPPWRASHPLTTTTRPILFTGLRR